MDRQRIFGLLVIYALARIISFYFQPGTPANSVIAIGLAVLTGALLIKKDTAAWYLIAGEFILGGTSSYFHAFGLSLRTILLLLVIIIYTLQNYKELTKNKFNALAIACLLTAGALGALRGMYLKNSFNFVIQDLIPYFFVWYYFPLKQLLKDPRFVSFCKVALAATVIGGAFFIGFTFIGYSSQLFILQDPYYHWFRDIAGGKITWVQFNFYRLVLNEHLLLIPTLLYYLHSSITRKERLSYLLSALLLFILSINLTRIYLLALAVGCVAIVLRERTRRALFVSAIAAVSFVVMFSALYLVGSHGQSFGFEVFGLRIQSIVAPNMEDSSLSRLLLLPQIYKLLQQHPLLGTGLGSTVTVFSPVFKTYITTPNFDWGYLEILTELGVIGFILWGVFVGRVFQNLKKLPGWQLPAFISFLVINVTSPALFHVLGITLLALLLATPNGASVQPASLPPRNQ